MRPRNIGTRARDQRLAGRRRRAPAVLGLILAAGLWSAATAAAEPEEIRGPDVTIIAEEERTVFEFRQGGVLRMIRVVPSWGKPYYLIPRDQTKGYEDLERAESLQPSWVILEF